MGIKKGTKLTDTPKNHMIRVRLDKETLEKLDAVCEEKQKSRSEVVRKGIEKQFAEIKNRE